jgi:beta-glucosidase
MNRQYLDPVFLGSYPGELRDVFGEAWPEWPAADFELIRQPIDFLGINYYTRGVMAHDATAWPLRSSYVRRAGARYTDTGWEVFPPGLTATIDWVRARYGEVPLCITENGIALSEPLQVSGEVLEDPDRVSYLRQHLVLVREAIARGADIRGYFAWSLLDNLEWAHGFSKRFGLFHVDHATQKRTPKTSARYYARVVRSNGAALDED